MTGACNCKFPAAVPAKPPAAWGRRTAILTETQLGRPPYAGFVCLGTSLTTSHARPTFSISRMAQ